MERILNLLHIYCEVHSFEETKKIIFYYIDTCENTPLIEFISKLPPRTEYLTNGNVDGVLYPFFRGLYK